MEKSKKTISLDTIILIFTVGSFLGYVVEMLWYGYKRGYFINRQGVIYGPFSPIYGFGAVLVTIALYKFVNLKPYIVITISGLLGASFEYMCAFLQEKIFGTYSWDYSGSILNINGRVDLKMTILWGIFGFLFIRYFYPLFGMFVVRFKQKNIRIVTWLITILMILNMGVSFLAAKRMADRRNGAEGKNPITDYLDENYPDDVLEEIFTNVKVAPD
ncbi:MAG: putative ABC transporter permease [Lachnospiraceae bacterium]